MVIPKLGALTLLFIAGAGCTGGTTVPAFSADHPSHGDGPEGLLPTFTELSPPEGMRERGPSARSGEGGTSAIRGGGTHGGHGGGGHGR